MRSDLIGIGDDQEHVLKIMGPPNDRQVKGSNEAWQYCQTTGAGFVYHDYRIIWPYNGKVTGITSHTSSRAMSEALKIAALSYTKDVSKMSCCAD